MAADRLILDPATVEDNPGDRQVEFVAQADGDEYQFAVRYSALEALSGDSPSDGAVAIFDQYTDEIVEAAASAVARDTDAEIIVITESDLD